MRWFQIGPPSSHAASLHSEGEDNGPNGLRYKVDNAVKPYLSDLIAEEYPERFVTLLEDENSKDYYQYMRGIEEEHYDVKATVNNSYSAVMQNQPIVVTLLSITQQAWKYCISLKSLRTLHELE